MERLTERIDNVPDGESGVWVKQHDYISAAEKLADYEDAEEHGQYGKWIPVSERLPEDGTYITTLDGELVGQEETFTSICGIQDGKWDEDECVIAWQPLPQPYQMGE